MKIPAEITSIKEIQELAMLDFNDWGRYGEVNVNRQGDLLLFTYQTVAQIHNRWNFFERVSRGLLINRKTGEVVARPFDKFFHWLSGPKASGHIMTVTEKVDGSLGILYRHEGAYHIITKGSFTSEQGLWATDFLRAHYDLSDLPNELTLLFEIIYPDNRIIVDYAGREDLVLLAARNRFTGDFLPFFPNVVEMANRYGFSLPKVFHFNSIDEIMRQTGKIGAEAEGWVVEFSDGQRFKFKGDRYIELHRIRNDLSFKNILAAVRANSINFVLDTTPDEFLGTVIDWITEIRTVRDSLLLRIQEAFDAAPKLNRKEFALWVREHHPEIATYLFALYDDNPVEPLIYQFAFRDRLKIDAEVMEF